jgi:putative flippase GtrA
VEIAKNRLEVLKFILAGLFCSGIEYVTFSLLLKGENINYLVANIFSICVSLTFSFFISKYFIFGKSGNTERKEVVFFILFAALAIALNQMILWSFVEIVKFDVRICKVIAIGAVAMFNYITKKHFVFK